MLLCMRTTINIDDDLLSQIKELAARNGTSMASIIEDALRQLVAAKKQSATRKKTRLTIVKGKGLRPGVDLDDASSLMDLMDRAK